MLRLLSHYKLWNLFLFQAGWIICVMSVAENSYITAYIAIVFVIIIHFSVVKYYDILNWKKEFALLICAGLLGLFIDSINVHLGIFETTLRQEDNYFAPLWLIGLWLLFSLTINHSLSWLKNKLVLSMGLGAIFAPSAYYAGVELGALYLPTQTLTTSLFVIAIEWSVVMPIILLLNHKIFVGQTVPQSLKSHI